MSRVAPSTILCSPSSRTARFRPFAGFEDQVLDLRHRVHLWTSGTPHSADDFKPATPETQ